MLRCASRLATVVIGGALGASAALAVAAPAQADEQVTIRGAGFPETRTAQLSLVGCNTLYDRTDEVLAPHIGRGPGQAPMGERSLGYDLGGGNAVGSLHYVDSMTRTTSAALSVFASDGADGVAYAGFQDRSDAGTTRLWIGRAPLSAPAGSWAAVEATQLTYTWTQYDMVTHVPVPTAAPAAPSTVARFAAGHGGDGAGFYTIGFGCDGSAFNMDAWQIGGPAGTTRYDLEGLATTTSIEGSAREVRKGEEVRLTGRLRLGQGDRLRSGTLMLESRPADGGAFAVEQVVDAAGAQDPTVVVRPTGSTVYRFRFAGRPMTEASESSLFVVTVVTGEEEPPALPDLPDPDEDPTADPTRSPNPASSAPTASPSATEPAPSQTPSQTASQTPSETASETPAGTPSQSPTATDAPGPTTGTVPQPPAARRGS